MDPTTARDMALGRLGDVRHLKRTCVDIGRKRDREMRLTQWLEELGDDVKVDPVTFVSVAIVLGVTAAIAAAAPAIRAMRVNPAVALRND
jgi:ABC-type lipoprotein release transport system permease subunit